LGIFLYYAAKYRLCARLGCKMEEDEETIDELDEQEDGGSPHHARTDLRIDTDPDHANEMEHHIQQGREDNESDSRLDSESDQNKEVHMDDVDFDERVNGKGTSGHPVASDPMNSTYDDGGVTSFGSRILTSTVRESKKTGSKRNFFGRNRGEPQVYSSLMMSDGMAETETEERSSAEAKEIEMGSME